MRERRTERGFTLFEVLGAVTILAVVYSWLATSAMQGMRSEGLSKRRLEASLLIDEVWMEIETDLATGSTPPVGRTETALEEPFLLIVDVTPFDPTPYLGEEFPPEGATSTLLFPPEREEEAFLRKIDLRVVWEEGSEEYAVQRTTLAFDHARVAELVPDEQAGDAGLEDPDRFVNPDGSPDLDALHDALGLGQP